MRVGKGFDIHRFTKGRPLYLGGVEVKHPKGLEGHSDADVLLHAVCDALLGASALGDIGELFPDSDPKYAGVRSEMLLKDCLQRVKKEGFRIHNLDSTVFCEAPRLSPYKTGIRENLARILEIPLGRINVKAKTLETMGALGKGEGIAAEAVVLLLESHDG